MAKEESDPEWVLFETMTKEESDRELVTCHTSPETGSMERRRLLDDTQDPDPRHSSDRRGTEDSDWERSSRRGSRRPLRPARLPVEPGDRRFAKKKHSRVHICDNCGSRNTYQCRAMPFDGQYLQLLSIRRHTTSALKQAFEDGELDATWFCTRCHQRDGESYEETRRRIEV